MESGKKYYWLKLDRNFFKRHDIRIIESQQNGKDYILFYLKLLVESIDHEGSLRFSEAIPYNEDMLATITNTNIDVVRSAMKVFTELEMIEVMDDQTIFMKEVQKMIGSETDEHKREVNRLRQQRYRDKKALCNADVTHSNANVTQCNAPLRNAEIEKEIEKDIEIDDDVTPSPSLDQKMDELINLWNKIPNTVQVQKIIPLTKRWNDAQICLNTYGIDKISEAFDRMAKSKYLTKRAKPMCFDNFVNVNVIQKTLEGNYDREFKAEQKPNGFKNFEERSYDYDDLEDKLFNQF